MAEIISLDAVRAARHAASIIPGALVQLATGERARVEAITSITVDGVPIPAAKLWFDFGKPEVNYPLKSLTLLPVNWTGRAPSAGDVA